MFAPDDARVGRDAHTAVFRARATTGYPWERRFPRTHPGASRRASPARCRPGRARAPPCDGCFASRRGTTSSGRTSRRSSPPPLRGVTGRRKPRSEIWCDAPRSTPRGTAFPWPTPPRARALVHGNLDALETVMRRAEAQTALQRRDARAISAGGSASGGSDAALSVARAGDHLGRPRLEMADAVRRAVDTTLTRVSAERLGEHHARRQRRAVAATRGCARDAAATRRDCLRDGVRFFRRFAFALPAAPEAEGPPERGVVRRPAGRRAGG
jgi:hypothetical protein